MATLSPPYENDCKELGQLLIESLQIMQIHGKLKYVCLVELGYPGQSPIRVLAEELAEVAAVLQNKLKGGSQIVVDFDADDEDSDH